MTDLLTALMQKVEKLPDERQQDVAQVLLTLLENDLAPYQLTDQQLREVDAALISTGSGRYASDEDVQRILFTKWA